MNREQQKQRIERVRRSIVAGAVAASLGVAAYLGLDVHRTGTTTDPADGGSSTPTTSDDSGSDAFAHQYGDGPTELSSGSGPAHARTSGS